MNVNDDFSKRVVMHGDAIEWEDSPVGSYIRNPPGSSHTPGSKLGCTILVKLCQFDPDDRTFVHANLNKLGAVAESGRAGVTASPVFKDKAEDVRFEYWEPGASVAIDASGGAEIFVLREALPIESCKVLCGSTQFLSSRLILAC